MAKSIYKFAIPIEANICADTCPISVIVRKRGANLNPLKSSFQTEFPSLLDPLRLLWRNVSAILKATTLGRKKNDNETFVGSVGRKSLYLMGCKVPRLKYSMDGLKRSLRPSQKIVKSMTFDNGVENVRHEELNVNTYFCDPYSSWQKPVIENTLKEVFNELYFKSAGVALQGKM